MNEPPVDSAAVSAHLGAAELTRSVKQAAIQAGAVLVGIAPIERFDANPPYYDKAPAGHDPRDFVPDAQSVISFAMPILNPVMDAAARLMDREVALVPPYAKQQYLDALYGTTGHMFHDRMLETVGQLVGQHLCLKGYEAMTFPTTSIGPAMIDGKTKSWFETWEGPSEEWADKYSPLRTSPGPISHRHVATRAGLGEFGYNNLVLTPQFGPRQRFNTVVTNAKLVPDPLITKPICLRDKCRLCMRACFMDAIRMRDDEEKKDYRSVESVDKECIFIDTPTKTFPSLCDRRREPDQENAPVRGDCARICPIPKLSKNLPRRLQCVVEQWRHERRDAAE